MARSGKADPLQTHLFALRELESPSLPVGNSILDKRVLSEGARNGWIGFQSLSMPDVSLELKEVNEGNWPHPHKIPMTRMTTGDVTLVKAVYPRNSDFYTWVFQALWGRGAPRRSFNIVHLGREANSIKEKRYILLKNCLPVSWKPGSDFDANSGDVSLEELTMHVESISLELAALTATQSTVRSRDSFSNTFGG
jgi:phage tail-like protein